MGYDEYYAMIDGADAVITCAYPKLFTYGEYPPLIGFRNMMDRHMASNYKCIWLIGSSSRTFSEQDRERFLVAEELRARIKCIQTFDDAKKQERWEWLTRSGVIICESPKLLPLTPPFNVIIVAMKDGDISRILLGADGPMFVAYDNPLIEFLEQMTDVYVRAMHKLSGADAEGAFSVREFLEVF